MEVDIKMAKEFKISTLRLKELEQELFYLKTTREKEVAGRRPSSAAASALRSKLPSAREPNEGSSPTKPVWAPPLTPTLRPM